MKLDIQIRASDITDTFADDFVTVKTDLSPPIIENLWLTRGDRLNISVHNVEDLTNLQYVWFLFATYDNGGGIMSYICVYLLF